MTRLDPDRRRRVLELAASARPAPGTPPDAVAARDWSVLGCAGLVVTVAGLMLVPSVAWLAGTGGGRIAVAVLGGLGLISLLVGLMGTRLGLAPIHRRVEATVETLAGLESGPDGTLPDEALEAAVALLLNAHRAPGPYKAEIFDAIDVARRLGPALPLVVAVEEVLLEAGVVDPLFTPVRPGGA